MQFPNMSMHSEPSPCNVGTCSTEESAGAGREPRPCGRQRVGAPQDQGRSKDPCHTSSKLHIGPSSSPQLGARSVLPLPGSPMVDICIACTS